WSSTYTLVSLIVIGSFLLSHSRALPRHYDDETQRENVTHERERIPGGPVRAESRPPAGGGVPDARLAQRGGGCRPGSVAAAQPVRHPRHREPRRLAHHGRRAGLPGPAAHAPVAARRTAGRARARP